MYYASMTVAKHLELNMPGTIDKALYVDIGVAEGQSCFVTRGIPRRHQLVFGADDPHTTATAARSCFDQYRKAQISSDGTQIVLGADHTLGSRNDWQTGFL